MDDFEEKPYYKIGEVCELTGTQPYVLRFWESEFPTLAPQKSRSGQRIYRKQDIELIRRIKTLLYEREYTIAGARKVLETGSDGEGHHATSSTDPGGHDEGARDNVSSASGRAAGGVTSELPFKSTAGFDQQLEAEVKNLRAKLARTEAELRSILADMDRRDER